MSLKSCINSIKGALFNTVGEENPNCEGSKSQENFQKFTYYIRCSRCNMEFSYKYQQIVKRQDYSRGFVYCPFCNAENAHTGIRFTVEDLHK